MAAAISRRAGGDGFAYRPNNLTRPGGEGGGVRPGANGGGIRDGGGSRPGANGGGIRPDGGGGRRPDGGGGNRPNNGNRPDNANWNHNGNWDHNGNWNHNVINHNDWHHGYWNGNWNHGWANRPAYWWGWGAGLGVGALTASVIPWSWGYWNYSNPYATAPYVVDDTTIDYSQPILASAPPQQASEQQLTSDQPTPADQSADLFAQARQSFAAEDYKTALTQVDQAIAKMPNDPALHEFRGLVLFAQGQYKDAAAVIYAVLSTGPGWDWTTMSSLYSNTELYTRQLRAWRVIAVRIPTKPTCDFCWPTSI